MVTVATAAAPPARARSGRLATGALGLAYLLAVGLGHDALFVRPWFRAPAIAAGLVLLAVAVVAPPRLAPGTALLLLFPVLMGAAIRPADIQDLPATLSAGSIVEARLGDGDNPLLDAPAGGIVDATVLEVVLAERRIGAVGLEGRAIRVDAVVAGPGHVSRLVMVCCAADARPVAIAVRDTDLPRRGTWVRLTGTLRADGDRLVLDRAAVRRLPPPTNPFL
jgi:hypothetical protein